MGAKAYEGLQLLTSNYFRYKNNKNMKKLQYKTLWMWKKKKNLDNVIKMVLGPAAYCIKK